MKFLAAILLLDAVLGGAAVFVLVVNECPDIGRCEQNITAMLIAYGILFALAILTFTAVVRAIRRRGQRSD